METIKMPPLNFSHYVVNAEKYIDNLLNTIRKKLLVNRWMGETVTYTEGDLIWAIEQEKPDLGGLNDKLSIRRMHEKLIKDGFVDEMKLSEESIRKLEEKGERVKGEKFFYLTYEGLCFEGYQNRKSRHIRENDREKTIAIGQFWLTLILAFGSIGLLIFEALKYFHIYPQFCH
ncbi:MAG TPA: hypothetical protein VK806_06760 [Bacteroidia bacterium]|jgi:hypothetical protein|nr:hypothetical protein [Bacteroidia bacterium]